MLLIFCILYLLVHAERSFETNGIKVSMKMKPRIVTIDLFVQFEDLMDICAFLS